MEPLVQGSATFMGKADDVFPPHSTQSPQFGMDRFYRSNSHQFPGCVHESSTRGARPQNANIFSNIRNFRRGNGGNRCQICNKFGHIANVCRERYLQRQHELKV